MRWVDARWPRRMHVGFITGTTHPLRAIGPYVDDGGILYDEDRCVMVRGNFKPADRKYGWIDKFPDELQ